MADPTVILDDAGEVMRMTNEEGDLKISQVMEARDSKGNPEEDSSSDFECFIELSEEDLALEFVKLSASDKSGTTSGLISTPSIREVRALGVVLAKLSETSPTRTNPDSRRNSEEGI